MIEEDSNSVLFVEDSNIVNSEITILNINVKVEKPSTIHKKEKFYFLDIETFIDFQKDPIFRLSVDYSKLHKCYYTKIKNKIDELTKSKLSFRETILCLSTFINGKDLVNCSCQEQDDLLFTIPNKPTTKIIRNECFPNCESLDKTKRKNDEKEKRETVDEEAQKKERFKSLNDRKVDIIEEKHEKKTPKKTALHNDKNVYVKEENENGKEKEKEKDIEEYELMKKRVATAELTKKKKNKDQFLPKCDSKYFKDNDNAKECEKEDTKEGQLSIDEMKEMSAFLGAQENKIKEENDTKVEKENFDKKVEDEKKKKRIKKINENVPLTVILSTIGNELCKNLIDKYSRYYRDFQEEKILGCGGFGYVMKVKDKRFNIVYALKKITLSSESNNKENYLNDHYDSKENAYNRYIMEEAIMIAKLKHEHIVRYYDAWVENNVDFYLYQEIIKPYEKELSEGTSRKDIEHIEKLVEEEHIEQGQNEGNDCEGKLKERKDKIINEKYVKEIYNYYKKNKNISLSMEDKYLYILMEYCPGKTLREAIDCGYIYKNEKLIWALCKQILKGISYIHEMKIIHRDIKPSNIFLQINDNMLTAKIGDFGLTTRIDNKEINPSAGTIHYISPEQINGEPFDQKADLFSLGVVFFEMFHEPFSTSMERSVVLSNLLKGIFPEYMKLDAKKLKFLCCLLAINPQDRPSAYNLLHDNFPFSFEKSFTEIYNLVENKRNCDETHTIIKTLFDKFEHVEEKHRIEKESIYCPSSLKKILNEDAHLRNKGRKKIIKNFKNRGAIFLITPIILLNKYYIDMDNIFIQEYSSVFFNLNKKKEKVSNIYINTSKNNDSSNLIYFLDIYGNVITLRSSFFLSISEYIYQNIEQYNKHNETNFFFKFYTYGCIYKNPVLSKTRQMRKEEFNTFIYPDETEKILYTILIDTKNIYDEEELYYLSVFSNADILVSVTTIYECISNMEKLLFLWSYADLLPFILNECFDIPKNVIHEVSSDLRKNSFLLTSKSSVVSLLQKYKIPNIAKVSDYIFNLFQLKCETNKVGEYLNTLQRFLEDVISKSRHISGNDWSNINSMKGGNIDSTGAMWEDNEKEDAIKREGDEKKANRRRDILSQMNVFYLLKKIKKINNFISTTAMIDNISFDLFLNYEESVFSNEIVFFVISENKNREIIAHGGKFDTLIKKLSNNNLLYIKCYGVEINMEKIQFKMVDYSDKIMLNIPSGFLLEKSNMIKNGITPDAYVNIFASDTKYEGVPETNTSQCIKNYDNIGIRSEKKNNIINVLNLVNQNINYSNEMHENTCVKKNYNVKNCVKNKYLEYFAINSPTCSNASLFYCADSPKIVIHVEKINTLLIAYDLSKKLLQINISSYTYLDIQEGHKKKNVKNYKTKKIKFLITIKTDMNNDSFNPLKPIHFNDVVYKIYNIENEEYNYLRQEKLLLYIASNI